eukprot:m.372174 g.372174  ORF g.372174 m.372174 type:complete len:811 (-) comp19992_c5_seq1:339-2771(-)
MVDRREQLVALQRALRNVCTIAHVDHGKTTLSDSLLARAHLLNEAKAGSACKLDTDPNEQARGITINATGISLRYDDIRTADDQGAQPLQVNLIDCPGHVDFSGEVTAALRLSDGAIVVVDPFDSKDGRLCPQTETVLRQALIERVRPVLFLNKIDKAFLGLQLDGQTAYRLFLNIIDLVNQVIVACQPEGFDFTVALEKGTVVFGSALLGFAFTPQQLADQMASKSGGSAAKIAARLCQETHFVSHIYDPLVRLFKSAEAAGNEDAEAKAALLALVEKLPGVAATLRKVDRELPAKDLMRLALRRWVPAAEAVLAVVLAHLPDPVTAQAYRAAPLYEGSPDDRYATGMKACDPLGPLVFYAAKVVPTPSKKLVYAYGRIFSGTVRTGAAVRVLGPDYEKDATDVRMAKVSAVKVLMADSADTVPEACAGSVVGLVGLAGAMHKSATVVDADADDAHGVRIMTFKVSPVVSKGVSAKKPGDARKVMDALRSVAQTDPTCTAVVDEATGQMLLSGAGELHLQVRLTDIQRISGVTDIETSEPIVSYQETIGQASPVCMSKSTNKHNKFHLQASPLADDLVDALADGQVTMTMELTARVNALQSFGWERDHGRKLLAIEGSNVLVDLAAGVDLSPVLDSLVTGFRQVCRRSVLCGEPLRGARFDIVDAKIHQDGPHRRADQIVPAARRGFNGAILKASPGLLEPFFQVDVQVDAEFLKGAFACIRRRRGAIVADDLVSASMHAVQAHIPVADSFGFTDALRGETHGRAFSTTSFSHWDMVEESRAQELVMTIRTRKKMPLAIPAASDFLVTA